MIESELVEILSVLYNRMIQLNVFTFPISSVIFELFKPIWGLTSEHIISNWIGHFGAG